MDARKTLVSTALATTLALAGCGGGGSDPNTDPALTASAGEDALVLAFTEATLSGAAEGGSGNTQYQWEQIAGPDVEIHDTNLSTASFAAVSVPERTDLQFRLTVTDDKGNTQTDDVTYTVRPAIRLKGRVFDGPVANAAVSVTLGEETFEANSDADGNYDLIVPNEAADEFVEISASRDDGVAFKQYAGTLESLNGDADTEDTELGEQLVAQDSAATNVTNLSTSKAVAMEEKVAQLNPAEKRTRRSILRSVDDLETLDALERAVDPEDVLNRAVAIKLVVDHDVPFPDGVNDTLELIEDAERLSEFVQSVNTGNPELYDEVLDDILDDQAGLIGYTADTVPEAIYSFIPAYYSTNGAYEFRFDSPNTGKLVSGTSDESFSWSVANGKIEIATISPQVNDAPEYLPDLDETVRSLTFRKSMTLSRAVQGQSSDVVAVTEIWEHQYPDDPDIDTRLETKRFNLLTVSAENIIAFDTAEFAGSKLLLLESCDMPVVEQLEVFADGTGNRLRDGMDFDWGVQDGIMTITFDDTTAARVIRTREMFGIDGKAHEAMITMDRDGADIDGDGQDSTCSGETLLVQSDPTLEVISEMLTGEFAELGGEPAYRGQTSAPHLVFRDDGVVERSFVPFLTGEKVDGIMQEFTWEIDGNGTLITRECLGNDAGTFVPRLVHADPDPMPGNCEVQYIKAFHSLIAATEHHLYFFRTRDLYEDFTPADANPPHEETLYDLIFISRVAEEDTEE
jgi:hypothetical protein